MNRRALFTDTFSRSFLAAVMALTIASTFTGCGSSPATLNQQNLDKIQPDMSAQEVKTILGEPTDSTTEPIPIVGGTKTTYTFTDKQGDRVVVVLKNDKVQTKEGHFGAGQ